MKTPENPLVFPDAAAWRAWLEAHHAVATEAWVVHTKKAAGPAGLSYEDAVEEALCFGWIDGLLRRLDAARFVLRYSPRRPGSVWAASNVARIERLLAEGRMAPAGLAAVAAAKASGEWDAALQREDVDALPMDLLAALGACAGAEDRFRALPASRRKQLLWWITSARRPATRAKRVRAVVEMVAAGEGPGKPVRGQ